MEKVRGDYLESEGSVEERSAVRALREGCCERSTADEGRYDCVSEQDPVLRSHCRLEPRE
jgi:hypothetical protein